MNDLQPTQRAERQPLLILAAVVGLLLVVLIAWLTLPATSERETETEGETVDFRLPSLAGDELGPSAYAGKVVVIDFWATWCAPCRVQAEILEAIRLDYLGQEIEFLAVSVGEDEQTVRSFVEREPFAYPVLFDPEDRVSAQLGIYALPTVVIVGRDGALAYRHSGISSEATVRTLLSQAGLQGAGPQQQASVGS